MGGSTIQLVSRGSQDIYLTGNPQITFFKVVYRRHTNFSMDDIILATIPTPGFGTSTTVTIKHLGDLIHKVSLVYKANNIYAGHGLANPTTALIDYVELRIGGYKIDKQFGHFIEAWMELTKPNPNGTICNISHIDDISISHLASNSDIAVATACKFSGSFSASKATPSLNDLAAPYYFNNRLNKLTNILGTGMSYPPTKFQKTSRCGGCYCEPTYLQEIQSGYQEDKWSAHEHEKFTDKIGDQISLYPRRINASLVMSASCSDFHITAATSSASVMGGNAAKEVGNRLNASGMITSIANIKKSLTTGSIIGFCTLDIPFWFNKDPGLSIPLIALPHSDVDLEIAFSSHESAFWTKSLYKKNSGDTGNNYMAFNGNISNNQNAFNAFSTDHLYPIRSESGNKINFNIDIKIQYIYLDTDERRRFSEISHEYLIEQVQHQHVANDKDIDLSGFSNPVKELIWCGKPYVKSHIVYDDGNTETSESAQKLNNGQNAHPSGTYFQPGVHDNIAGGSVLNSSYTLGFGNQDSVLASHGEKYTADHTKEFNNHGKFVVGLLGPSTPRSLDDCNWQISINDLSRTSILPLQHYTRNNVHNYHTGYGSVCSPDSIAVYSFALKPEEHQPSGTCNFSNIDRIMLHRYKGQAQNTFMTPLNVYAINYNILRIMGGKASMAYM